MKNIAVIDAPSILGLRPSGVERLPEALRGAGLVEKLGAFDAGKIVPPPYQPHRDEQTRVLNSEGIRDFSLKLADAVQKQREQNRFPLVLGGDCSIIIGCLLALRRQGKYGLFFIDGHADFYQPAASPTGEVADMDLAIVTGRGPEVLTNIGGKRPLVKDSNVVAFGYRDSEEQKRYGSQDITATEIHAMELPEVKRLGVNQAASQALQGLLRNRIEGFWIHLDADVIDDALMPAVDYRLPGGLHFEELSEVLSVLLASQKAVGMSIAILNPALDKDGSVVRAFVRSVVKGFEVTEVAAKPNEVRVDISQK